MPFTKGFRSRRLLEKHYDDHHLEIGVSTEADYLGRADAFLGDSLGPTVRECIRASDGAVIRWDYASQEFGVLAADGFIQTYFIAHPRWHGFPTNRAYFQYECGR